MMMTLRNSGNVNYKSGLEDRDIYVSHQDDNGRWSAPVNLGTDVNTPYNEVGPYMAADGRTLYFGSAGRPGYGTVDMFMTRRQGDGWTSWSEPVNLGPEINSQGFDAYYVVPVSGEYAYMVSNLEGYGNSDIVRIKLPKQVTPDPVMLVSGRTLDAKTGKPVDATIRVDNLKDGTEMARSISNQQRANSSSYCRSDRVTAFMLWLQDTCRLAITSSWQRAVLIQKGGRTFICRRLSKGRHSCSRTSSLNGERQC
jgi:hypothetical protein